MAIAEVRKVHLLAHRDEAQEVISFLQGAGVVEITAPPGEGRGEGSAQRLDDAEALLRRLDWAVAFLRPWMPKQTFLQKLYAEKPLLTRREVDDLCASFDLKGVLTSCEEKDRRIQALAAEISAAAEERRSLVPWSRLGVSPSHLERAGPVRAVAGRFPAVKRKIFDDHPGARVALEVVAEDERQIHAVLFYHADCSAALQEKTGEAGFVEAAFPELECTPAERIAAIDGQILKKKKRIGELRHSLSRLAAVRWQLLVMRDVVASQVSRLRVEALLEETTRTVSIQGWAAGEAVGELRRALAQRFRLASIEDFPPGPHDHVPVILRNPAAVRPFGLVVDLYGLPRYGAIDPSGVMAAFFALFFGLCLTDAGYGLVLAGLTGALLLAAPPGIPAGRKRFFQLFFLCGLATVITGAAAGGWFGLKAPVRFFDPLDDLMLFFVLSLAAGTLHLFAGLALRMTRLVRAGDTFGAVVDHGVWMVLVLSLCGLGASAGGLGPPAAERVFGVGTAASALVIVFFQGRPGEEGDPRPLRHLPWAGAALAGTFWFAGVGGSWPAAALLLALAAAPLLTGVSVGGAMGRIGLGLYALYGITGYLSDVLSYSRLVALGLATGIIALVVNKMAVVAGGIPLLGAVMTAGVLVVGHLFNIVINLLGAFVHSCRLQYVEFFTKFYESGGKPFSPFRLETRYITIREQNGGGGA